MILTELRVLKYFLTVAQEENISHAADILHVTQPTLSRQLADLEYELGVKLFRRGNRRITLTESGLLLRRRAEEVLTLIDKIEQEVREPSGPVDGTVSIGSAEAAATEVLPPLLQDFSEKYPQVRYELFTGNADIIKERIDKGLLDIGLLTEPVELSRYEFLRLKERDRWGIITYEHSPLAEKSEVTIDDLKGLPLMLPRRAEVQKNLAHWFGEQADNLQVFATYNLIGNATQLVSQCLCHAFALECAVTRYNSICFRPLAPDLITSSVLVWKRHQPSSEAVRRFIQEITIRFGNS